MTEPVDPTHRACEHPDGAGYRDVKATPDPDQPDRSQQKRDAPRVPGLDFNVVNDEKTGVYKAIAGNTEIAGMPYIVADDERLVLLATAVIPEFRNQGVATRLIRRVLDDVRAQGKTITVVCPIVRHFIERNPEYADLIDPKHPGRANG